MNGTIYNVCSQASDAEKGNIPIRPLIPFVPEFVIKFGMVELRSQASSNLSMAESTQAHRGDCRGMSRETPENQ